VETRAERAIENGIAEVRTLSARALLGAGKVIRIEHEGEIYMLRLTRNNKLILTK
jgi:hemin uptake protein HemP